jgi:hypothetical protein
MIRRVEDLSKHSPKAPIPNAPNGGVDKIRKYGWSEDPGEMGEFHLINKNQLIVDLNYQREHISEGKVRKIASKFSWSQFGALTVVRCEDGRFVVVDGGHRLAASLNRGDVEKLPCLVFEISGIRGEAELFLRLGEERLGISPYDRHRAALVAGRPVAVRAEAILKNCGYRTARQAGSGGFWFDAIASLEDMVSKDPAAAQTTFEILAEVAGGLVIKQQELKGLFYLVITNKRLDFKTFPMKNLVEAGLGKIQAEIARYRLLKNKGGEKIAAEAMLEIINNRQQKNKVRIPD